MPKEPDPCLPGARDQVLCSHDQLGKAEAAVVLSWGGCTWRRQFWILLHHPWTPPQPTHTSTHATRAGQPLVCIQHSEKEVTAVSERLRLGTSLAETCMSA